MVGHPVLANLSLFVRGYIANGQPNYENGQSKARARARARAGFVLQRWPSKI